MKFLIPLVILVVIFGGWAVFQISRQSPLPKGETVIVKDTLMFKEDIIEDDTNMKSNRQIFITDNVKHSVPIDEILSGGPPKDGIPSIDNPKFISPKEAGDFLSDESVGLGFIWKGEARFYPYNILVWHEIVNDTIQGDPILVTYCPLCATGVVFDSKVDGETIRFGTSGKLWQSNLLMYNRQGSESLWSQVLGEAVLGELTSTRLKVLSADTVKYGAWKKANPNTKVLSQDTGTARSYGVDPYGDYYTDRSVSFGATFNDDRLHPKTFVVGIEIDGQYKAYDKESLPVGKISDSFAGKSISVKKNKTGQITILADAKEISHVGGFWFSWLAVHPNTELFK